jgi:transposase
MSSCRHRSPWTCGLRIVRAVEDGSSSRGAARRFALSPSAAIKLMQRVRATGSAAPVRYGGHRRPLLAPHEADLHRLVEATPGITLADLQAELLRQIGIVAGLSTIHNAKLKALLRKAAARTRDALWSTIGRLLETVPENECPNYLSHCGYGAT